MVAAAAGVAAVVAVPATSWASPPDQGTFSSHELFVDSEVCAPEGFPVNVVEDFAGDFQINLDDTGAVQFVVVHIDGRWVLSANGITLVERDKWTEFYNPDGTKRMVDNSVHITGPDPGLVQHDAGQVTFNPDGTVTIHGPHPQFDGQTWCFALLP